MGTERWPAWQQDTDLVPHSHPGTSTKLREMMLATCTRCPTWCELQNLVLAVWWCPPWLTVAHPLVIAHLKPGRAESRQGGKVNSRDYQPSCLEMESPDSCSHREHGSTTYPMAVTLC